MRAVICGVVLTLALSLGACKQEVAEEPSEAPSEAPAEGQAAEEQEAAAEVDVPEEGKEFEPPVEVSQVPAGAWYCDMGTVHWAQLEEGEGRCPLCKMKLVKKLPEAGAEEEAGAEGETGGE